MNLQPDIIMGSHSFVMNQPQQFLHRYRDWAQQMIALYKELLPDRDYQYLYDPYWVSAYPYRVDLEPGQATTVQVTIRNFRSEAQQHRIRLVTPDGITAEPEWLIGSVPAQDRASFPVVLKVNEQQASKGVSIVPFDIQLDDKNYGEWFDFLVRVGGD